MTIRLPADATIVPERICPAEDAEFLSRHQADDPHATVDSRECDEARNTVA